MLVATSILVVFILAYLMIMSVAQERKRGAEQGHSCTAMAVVRDAQSEAQSDAAAGSATGQVDLPESER